MLKCTIDNVAVDITYRQAGSMAVSLLMESADRHFGKDHLFKKSVLLVKAWCVHESPKYNGQVVLGSNHFALSTYAVNIMILAVLNGPSGAHITTPFQSLIGFFETFGNFDWTGLVVTMYGPMTAEQLRESTQEENSLWGQVYPHSFPKKTVLKIRAQMEKNPHHLKSKTRFPPRPCKVLDPLEMFNNVARAVSYETSSLIFKTLQQGFVHVVKIMKNIVQLENCNPCDEPTLAKETTLMVKDLFSRTSYLFDKSGSRRPDLLRHPFQKEVPYDTEAFECANDTRDVFLVILTDLRKQLSLIQMHDKKPKAIQVSYDRKGRKKSAQWDDRKLSTTPSSSPGQQRREDEDDDEEEAEEKKVDDENSQQVSPPLPPPPRNVNDSEEIWHDAHDGLKEKHTGKNGPKVDHTGKNGSSTSSSCRSSCCSDESLDQDVPQHPSSFCSFSENGSLLVSPSETRTNGNVDPPRNAERMSGQADSTPSSFPVGRQKQEKKRFDMRYPIIFCIMLFFANPVLLNYLQGTSSPTMIYWAKPHQAISFAITDRIDGHPTVAGRRTQPYQWLFNNVPIIGETQPIITIDSVTSAHMGIYRCISTSLSGFQTVETSIELAVAALPTPTRVFMKQNVYAGSELVYSAPLSGSPSPTFQWRQNGVNITMATDRTLRIPQVTMEDQGIFTCLLCNVAGCAEWKELLVTITP